MFSELVKRNSRRSRRENGLFFTSLLIAIIAFYIILSLSHQDVMVFLQRMESNAVNRLLTLVPVLYGLTLFILFFLVYYANRFQLARRRHEFGLTVPCGSIVAREPTPLSSLFYKFFMIVYFGGCRHVVCQDVLL